MAGFLPLLGPGGMDGVTVIARIVRGSSLAEVGASVISGLGPQTPDTMKSSAAYWYHWTLVASSIVSLSSTEAWCVMRLNIMVVACQ